MRTVTVFTIVLLSATAAARADFSYTTTRKATGGAMAAAAGNAVQGSQKFYFKGQKMKVDNGDMAEIIDFDARTVTIINTRQKAISVRSFDDLAATAQPDASAKIDVKETGQKKAVNGYNASELVMTMDVDSPQTRQMGKMQMEMDMWISSDVPGAKELRAFYEKNAARFPWAAMAGDSNQGMTAGIADMQRKVAGMNGVPVQQIVKIRTAGGGSAAPAMPQMSAAQAAQMQDAMAKLRALQAQGGPAAAAAAQAMARMGNVPGASGAPAGGAGSSMMEITMESSDFSTSSIPDSVFAIPSGYQNLK